MMRCLSLLRTGVLLSSLLVGCGGKSPAKPADPKEERKLPPEIQADSRPLVESNHRFAFDLYARLRGNEGNLFLSPYSISTAFAMARSCS